ncbi:transposase [Streptomyces gibsoniae]|uniref:transposase n=1 Tax=Streptomyces gibsoniae TaxID=3075529 RepID=UPI00374E0D3A
MTCVTIFTRVIITLIYVTRWEPNLHIRRGRSVICTLHAHLVLTPKYRRGPFTGEILTRCEKVMRDVCTDFAAELNTSQGDRRQLGQFALAVHPAPGGSPTAVRRDRARRDRWQAAAIRIIPVAMACRRLPITSPKIRTGTPAARRCAAADSP